MHIHEGTNSVYDLFFVVCIICPCGVLLFCFGFIQVCVSVFVKIYLFVVVYVVTQINLMHIHEVTNSVEMC